MTAPSRSWLAPTAAVALLALVVAGVLPSFWVALLNYIGIASLVALGLVLLTGVGGMTSFGQAAFVGFGAYTTAVLTVQFGWSPWLTLFASLGVTALGAVLVGVVTVRLSGHFLPLGTIAWGAAFYYLFGNMRWLGAHDGMFGIPPLSVAGYDLVTEEQFFVVVWAFLMLAVVVTWNLLDSRTGRAIRALRRGPIAAQAFGVNTARAKLLVFVYAAILAGLAGWLTAHLQRSVSPGTFGLTAGTEYLLMAVIGGPGRIAGAILGAGVVTLLRDQLQDLLPLIVGSTGNYEIALFGALLVVVLHKAPLGLWPLIAGPLRAPAVPDKAGALAPSRAEGAALAGAPLLEAREIRKSFGGLVAVNDVSFAVEAGEIVGLIGPNGAGKSTTFDLVTGIQAATAGDLLFRGAPIPAENPQAVAALGIGRTFQHVHLVPDMSVLENVALGAHLRSDAAAMRSMVRLDRPVEASLLKTAMAQIERVGLSDLAGEPCGNLALGQLRLVEIARALCLDPVLFLLDEPAAGLRFAEKKALAGLLRELRADGVAILLVEHDMDFVMSLADRLVVLDFGTKIAEGLPEAVRSNPRVREAYLGSAAA